jgi:hypothetical protein
VAENTRFYWSLLLSIAVRSTIVPAQMHLPMSLSQIHSTVVCQLRNDTGLPHKLPKVPFAPAPPE